MKDIREIIKKHSVALTDKHPDKFHSESLQFVDDVVVDVLNAILEDMGERYNKSLSTHRSDRWNAGYRTALIQEMKLISECLDTNPQQQWETK